MADKKIQYILDVDPTTGVAGVKRFTGEVERGTERAKEKTLSLRDAVAAIGFGYVAKQLVDFGASAVREFGRAEAAAFGLQRATGANFADLTRRSEQLAAATRGLFAGDEIKRSITTNFKMMERLGLSADQVFAVVSRGADQAAIKNRTLEDTSQALFNALRGEAESAKSLGVDLSDTYMKTVAFNGALADSWDRLTAGEKAQLRYQQAMEQTSHTVGAAADKVDTIEGSIQAANVAWGNMTERLGKELTPAVKDLAKTFSDDLFPQLEKTMGVVGPIAADAIKFWSKTLAEAAGFWADTLVTTPDQAFTQLKAKEFELENRLKDTQRRKRLLSQGIGEIGTNAGTMNLRESEIEGELRQVKAQLALFQSVENAKVAASRAAAEEIAKQEQSSTATAKQELTIQEAQASASARKAAAAKVQTSQKAAEDQKKIETDFLRYSQRATMSATDFEIEEAYREYDAWIALGQNKEEAYQALLGRLGQITDRAAAQEVKAAEKLEKDLSKISQGFTADFTRDWTQMIENFPSAGELAARAVQDTFSEVQKSISNFMQTGQLDFEAFAQQVVATWANMAAQLATQQIVVSLTAAVGGGAAAAGAAGAGAAGAGAAGAGAAGAAGAGAVTLPAIGAVVATVVGAYTSAWLGREGAGRAGINGANEKGIATTIAGFLLGGPLGGVFGAGMALDGGMFGGGKDESKQTKWGVKDAQKDPVAAIAELAKKFADFAKKGDSAAAGFVLQQIDDINDRFIKNSDISAALKGQWDKLTDAAFQAGRAVEEFGVGSEQATAATAELQRQATATTIAMTLGGEASSEAAQAAAELAIQSNNAATAAQTELDAMSRLADTLYRASENTWALSQSAQAAEVAQKMLAMAADLTYEKYQQLQGAYQRLTDIEKERKALMDELLAGATSERYAEIQAQLINLNKEAASLIGTMTGTNGPQDETAAAMDKVGASADQAAGKTSKLSTTLEKAAKSANVAAGQVDQLRKSLEELPADTWVRVEFNAKPKTRLHSGRFSTDIEPWETEAVIRRDEDVVPPERRVPYARAVLAQAGAAMADSGGMASAPLRSSVTVTAPIIIDGRRVAEAVIPIQLEMSRSGITVVDSRGVGSGLK